jgi:hypothetical protein
VHIVHQTAEQNISDAQVKSQIVALNKDYRAKNTDARKVPPVWKSLVLDSKIQFALATKDPAGKATTGITRTATTADSFGPDDTVKAKKTGGVPPWPPDRYLNIWVCNLSSNLLGYAQFPGGPPRPTAWSSSTARSERGAGRWPPSTRAVPATHEIGHFLGLRHIWGDRNDCSGNDFVADTPPAQQANTGKPTFPHITCNNGPSGDMFMNYMDYVDDDAMFMFTTGQVARMNATLAGRARSWPASESGDGCEAR